MFDPTQIMFAPTGECNLHCGHCRVERPESRLAPGPAIALLEEARDHGVDRIGFTGGEPFLAPDFLLPVIEAALRLDYSFDRLMTNGVWAKDAEALRTTLQAVADAGFDGTIALSYDSWHAQKPEEAAAFLKTVHEVFGRRDCTEIVYAGRHSEVPEWWKPRGGEEDHGDPAGRQGNLSMLADLLDGVFVADDPLFPFAGRIVDPSLAPRSHQRRGYRRTGVKGTTRTQPVRESVQAIGPETLLLPVRFIPFSPPSDSPLAWDAQVWFEDDYCEGPGNTFYVHPDGRIAVCCGFANEDESLIAGRLGEQSFGELVTRARALPQVQVCYDRGINVKRLELAGSGILPPGIARDQCILCSWMCSRAGSQ